MPVSLEEVDTLVAYCEAHFGDHSLWKKPSGYADSLALCIIDAIYSTGSHYTSVTNVIRRYRERRGDLDGAARLLDSFDEAGGARRWALTVANNEKPAHTRQGAPLKAEVVEQAARLMVSLAIDTVEDLVSQVSVDIKNNPVEAGWKQLPSQASGVTYNYLLILAGRPSVKPDRMVLRFLASVLGTRAALSTDRAIELISATADALGVRASDLDHAVWRAASGRSLTD